MAKLTPEQVAELERDGDLWAGRIIRFIGYWGATVGNLVALVISLGNGKPVVAIAAYGCLCSVMLGAIACTVGRQLRSGSRRGGPA